MSQIYKYAKVFAEKSHELILIMEAGNRVIVSKNKNILGSFLDTISKWYEFVVYGFWSLFLALLFFPSHSKFISILAIFGIFISIIALIVVIIKDKKYNKNF